MLGREVVEVAAQAETKSRTRLVADISWRFEVKGTLVVAKTDLFTSQSGNPTTTFFVHVLDEKTVLDHERQNSS